STRQRGARGLRSGELYSDRLQGVGLRLISTSAAMPANRTPDSSRTDSVCNRSKDAPSGLPAAVADTDPICARNASMDAITQKCETQVNAIISATSSGAGRTRAAGERSNTIVAIR